MLIGYLKLVLLIILFLFALAVYDKVKVIYGPLFSSEQAKVVHKEEPTKALYQNSHKPKIYPKIHKNPRFDKPANTCYN